MNYNEGNFANRSNINCLSLVNLLKRCALAWKMSVHIVEATYLDQNNNTTVQQISN